MYYAYVEKTDILRYASIIESTYEVTYEYSIALPADAPPAETWLTMAADELDTTVGYFYIFINTYAQHNIMVMIKKSDGTVTNYAK